jgi:hypothetical protein
VTESVPDIDDLGDQIAQLRDQMGQLAEQNLLLVKMMAELETRVPSPVPPRTTIGNGFVDNATAEQRQELTGWVDWLITAYDLLATHSIKPCWPNHPGAVEELAALYQAWQEALGQGGAGPATWHGQYLAPALTRLGTLYQISRCRPDKCEGTRSNPPSALPWPDLDISTSPALPAIPAQG